MVVAKVKGGYVVKHCHGAAKGTRINATKHPVSKAKAMAIHKAIQASRKGK